MPRLTTHRTSGPASTDPAANIFTGKAEHNQVLRQPDPAGNGATLLLRPRDAARSLAISERTLWELTRRGAIPSVRIARSVRYSPLDLQAWIDSQKRPDSASAAVPQS